MSKPFLADMTCKHDGRVLHLNVFVNSDEDLNEVLARVQKAARGQHRAAVVVTGALAANPRSRHVDDDGKDIP